MLVAPMESSVSTAPNAARLLLALQSAQVVLQSIELSLPQLAVFLDIVGDLLEGRGSDSAGPPLRLASLRDEPRLLQHLQVPRDRGEADVEGLGELVDCGFARGEPREDGASRRIGEGRERHAEAVGHMI